jgi:hypothetical protein
MRRGLRILVVFAALVMWTAVSFEWLVLTVGTGQCSILSPVGQAGTGASFHPLTQAEVDAITAGCSQPKLGDLVIPAIGYILIVTLGIAYASSGKREVSPEALVRGQ